MKRLKLFIKIGGWRLPLVFGIMAGGIHAIDHGHHPILLGACVSGVLFLGTYLEWLMIEKEVSNAQ